jgi:L-asparaginase II
MDNTMYVFDGESRAKSNLALAVITKCAEAKKPTLEQLQETFVKQATTNETKAKVFTDTSDRKRHSLDCAFKCEK